MSEAMVTGRMTAEKKAAGNRVLEKAGLNASQAVNLMYDRLVENQNADFLSQGLPPTVQQWQMAAELVDSLPLKVDESFLNMSRGEAKLARAKSRGVI